MPLGIIPHVFADIEVTKKKLMSLKDMQYFITTLPASGNFILSAVMWQASAIDQLQVEKKFRFIF